MILRVNVYKFDGSNPIGWVTLMEHYFLQGVTNEMMKHQMSVLYFDMEQPWSWFLIKHRDVIVLIGNENIHNFIHCQLSKEIHCYAHIVHNFQIMMANGGMMYCGSKCENVKFQMGDYLLKPNMFTIEMGGYDIII